MIIRHTIIGLIIERTCVHSVHAPETTTHLVHGNASNDFKYAVHIQLMDYINQIKYAITPTDTKILVGKCWLMKRLSISLAMDTNSVNLLSDLSISLSRLA